MDGPNVNLKFYETIATERTENEQHQLINIRSCELHTIHGACKTGFEKVHENKKDSQRSLLCFS